MNAGKFCEFHGEAGHTTDECMHLKRQIEEMLKAGNLSHLIKELKQSNGKDQEMWQRREKTIKRRKVCGMFNSHTLTNSNWYMEGTEPLAAVEGYEDAIQNMETYQNVETGDDHHGDFHFSLSDDEENELPYVLQATTTVTNATREPRKQKKCTRGITLQRKKPNMEARLEGIDDSFRMFIQGFNTNFGTMANVVASSMNDDNMRQKAASEKMKDVLAELMKLNLPSGDVLQAADIFSANKDKIDIFLNLSEQLRVSYVLKLTGLASGN
ncbi:hypothetical protein Tco_1546202 [Tanacetum coccineum]